MHNKYHNTIQKSVNILFHLLLVTAFILIITSWLSVDFALLNTAINNQNHHVKTANNTVNTPYYYVTHDAELTLEHTKNKGKIIIPATYYVRTLGEADYTVDGITYRKVSYNNVVGTIEVSRLSTKTMADVQVPYFVPKENLIAQNKNTEEHIELWLYHNVPTITLDAELLSKDIELKYIARSAENSDYIYVRTIEDTPRYGYVLTKNYTPTVIQRPNPNPINPDTVVDKPVESPIDESKTSNTSTNQTVKIILIVTLCLLAVLIVFLIFKPVKKKKPSRDDFYEI